MKSLISNKKPASPTITHQQIKKEINQPPQEKKTQLYNDLDKLFMSNNNEKEVASKRKQVRRKKPPIDEFSDLIEKKIKKENI